MYSNYKIIYEAEIKTKNTPTKVGVLTQRIDEIVYWNIINFKKIPFLLSLK